MGDADGGAGPADLRAGPAIAGVAGPADAMKGHPSRFSLLRHEGRFIVSRTADHRELLIDKLTLGSRELPLGEHCLEFDEDGYGAVGFAAADDELDVVTGFLQDERFWKRQVWADITTAELWVTEAKTAESPFPKWSLTDRTESFVGRRCVPNV